MTGLLVSVRDLYEAEAVLRVGTDILDLKNPDEGALGRLPHEIISEVAKFADGRCVTSATIGDLAMKPQLLAEAVLEVGSAGVDIVKVGFFGGDEMASCAHAVAEVASERFKLVAVLMADKYPDYSLIPILAGAGFYGVMLDTADKLSGSLTDCLSFEELDNFCKIARNHGLVTGLAGSLRESHIATLHRLQPDYLGFRGAVCESLNRNARLDASNLEKITSMLQKCNMWRSETLIQ